MKGNYDELVVNFNRSIIMYNNNSYYTEIGDFIEEGSIASELINPDNSQKNRLKNKHQVQVRRAIEEMLAEKRFRELYSDPFEEDWS